MTSWAKRKLELKSSILGALAKNGKANLKVFISSLKLETGFSEKSVSELITDLHNVGAVKLEGDYIYPVSSEPKPGKNETDK